MKYPFFPLLLCFGFWVIATGERAQMRRLDLLEARIHCDEVQAPNIAEYAAHPNVLADPPWTYCSYLAEEQPDILLKQFGS